MPLGDATAILGVDLPPGTLFDDRYEIELLLGHGGMGVVYRARDRSLDERVAIKLLRPDYARDPRMAERFKSEIRLARRVRHRNVCAIHDFGEAAGLLYISMELAEGLDLKRMIRQHGALPLERACDVILQACAGLDAVHEAGIVHRDIKSPNIMVEPSGLVRLMDFGIAKREDTAAGVTLTGQVVGTPDYMSPEQAQGTKTDARSDVYSLGVVAYEVLTGRVPFHGDTPISTILKHIHDQPPLDGPPAEGLSPALRQVLRHALAKDPADRYRSAAAFAEALRQALPELRLRAPSTAALDATTLRTPSRPAGAHVATVTVTTPAATASPLVTVTSAPPASARASRASWLLAASLCVALIAAALAWSRRSAPVAPAAAPTPASAPTVPASAPSSVQLPVTPTPAPSTPAPTALSRAARERLLEARPVPPPSPHATPAPRPAPAEPAEATATESPALPTTGGPQPMPPTTMAMQSVANGSLQLGVKPWAEVTIDGTVVGTTPLDKIRLAPGRHRVRLQHPAYPVVEREVVILPGQTERLLIDLAARP
jgi:serine/threonine-protein kinase